MKRTNDTKFTANLVQLKRSIDIQIDLTDKKIANLKWFQELNTTPQFAKLPKQGIVRLISKLEMFKKHLLYLKDYDSQKIKK